MYGPPVDLSFKGLVSATDALVVNPRTGCRPLYKNLEGKYRSRSLRLNNNSLADLASLVYICDHFLAQPWKIGWLDLSFNKIIHIEQVVCELRELRVLYLHGNCIWELSEVDKLQELQHLHSITLHGNAIVKDKIYRKHVLFTLPHLKMMDFSAVTREERVLANVCHPRSNRGKVTKESLP
ncbi:leucine-rich repeat-containing protein 51-like [Anoplopoma fimbria]|uniref:leucine-rich repeat-containing protein 51-like n=1 Tax=Anoplopoma fimbria TaxID=229290 RepID=UPI0023ED6B4A|nr:leucine-rich repeat-containing protein 51-like [Anoplopoma fimbria]